MFKLYLDKPEDFTCEVSVRNASIKNSIARMIVESEDVNLVFHGKIENGKCKIPIKKMKGILPENTRGKMHLEVIVEDTYFKPWESEYTVEQHTSLKVNVNEQISESTSESVSKPMVKVKSVAVGGLKEETVFETKLAIKGLQEVLEKFDITQQNIKQKMPEFKQVIKEYFKMNPELLKDKKIILNNILISI